MREFEEKTPEVIDAILTKVCRLKLLQPELQPFHSFCNYCNPHGAGVKLRCGSTSTHRSLSTETSSRHCLIQLISIQHTALRLESCKSHQLYCLKIQRL